MKKQVEKIKKGTTMDDLAVMVQKGFVETREYIDKGLGSLKKELKFDIAETRRELTETRNELSSSMEDLRLEVEHRRVHIFDHKDLEFRVEKIEEKFASSEKC